MAVDVNNAKRPNSIAFTLPISCQICLGKVKHPVLCPNNHVFCSSCMEVWLERNQQCPACRTPISEENPCKEIRGGISVVEEEDRGSMSTAELRRARLEMLFKDYESELSYTQAKMEALKVENTALQQQLEIKASVQNYVAPQVKEPDIDAMAVITKKLQDANKQYEKAKQELSKLKKANEGLKEENDLVVRENQRLRMEISSRSPHRYGRTTVAALQSQIDSYEKEVHQLNRALEKSDGYIEDLEKELLVLRGSEEAGEKPQGDKGKRPVKETLSKPVQKQSHKKQLFMDNGVEKDTLLPDDSAQSSGIKTSTISQQKVASVTSILVNNDSKDAPKPSDSPTKGSKKVTFALPEDTPPSAKMSSFDLEMPSPFSQSSTLNSDQDSRETTPTTMMLPPSDISKPKVAVEPTKQETVQPLNPVTDFKAEVNRSKNNSSNGLNDTLEIESELDELDISVTPELKDCLKLFNMAERKVQERNSIGGRTDVKTSTDSPLEQPSPLVQKQTKYRGHPKGKAVSSDQERHSLTSEWVSHTLDSKVSVPRVTGPTAIGQTSHLSASVDSYKPSTFVPSSSLGNGLTNDYSMGTTSIDRLLASESYGGKTGIPSANRNDNALSGSVVSNVFKANAQHVTSAAVRHKTTMDSGTFLLSQSLSNPNTSSAPVITLPNLHGVHGTDNGRANTTTALSQSLVANANSTDSLTSSLWKLEQTLAAHRSSSSHLVRPATYPAVAQTSAAMPGVGAQYTMPSSTYQLTSVAPQLPSTTTGQNFLKSLPFSTGHPIPLFSQSTTAVPSLPPPIEPVSGATHLAPSCYPPATLVSNSILYGQSGVPPQPYQSNSFQTSGQISGVGWRTDFHLTQPDKYPVPGVSNGAWETGMSRTITSVTTSQLPQEKSNNFSYVSNSSLNSNMSTLDGSFLPEPKKRLFETDTDDTDMSFSPIKSSKLR